jgi:hypothetical protein
MGKVKSMLMDAEERIYGIPDIEGIISNSETPQEALQKAIFASEGELDAFSDIITARQVISDMWNEYWGNYV